MLIESIKSKLRANAGPLLLMLTVGMAPTLAVASLSNSAPSNKKNNITDSSVMITNLTGNHGGTGVILTSTKTKSTILTNSHVCGVIENGGMVVGRNGTFIVATYKHSQMHDLCLLTVEGNMGVNTKVANRPPRTFEEEASISGHPALLPNVVTKGHFSGRKIITIMVDPRPCTQEELDNPEKGLLCRLTGGLPMLRQYDAVLVTATIMPGSSGSGVYNEDLELSGLAFAGGGGLGYAFVVPYESLVNFLEVEQKNLPEKLSNTKTDVVSALNQGKDSGQPNNSDIFENIRKVCNSKDAEKIKELCDLSNQDILWHKN